MMTKIRDLMARREAGEKGFTLVELLVVIIIIGILAAVAIPIFLNQQKSGVDSNTTSDVRNVATNMETLRVQNPMAQTWEVTNRTATGATIEAYNADTSSGSPDGTVDVSLSEGTEIAVEGTGQGTFIVVGWNENGNADGGTSGAPTGSLPTGSSDDYIVYNSNAGGLQ